MNKQEQIDYHNKKVENASAPLLIGAGGVLAGTSAILLNAYTFMDTLKDHAQAQKILVNIQKLEHIKNQTLQHPEKFNNHQLQSIDSTITVLTSKADSLYTKIENQFSNLPPGNNGATYGLAGAIISLAIIVATAKSVVYHKREAKRLKMESD